MPTPKYRINFADVISFVYWTKWALLMDSRKQRQSTMRTQTYCYCCCRCCFHYACSKVLTNVILFLQRRAFFSVPFILLCTVLLLSFQNIEWGTIWFIAISWCIFYARPIKRVHRAHSLKFSLDIQCNWWKFREMK